jgi:Peptidase A4 family
MTAIARRLPRPTSPRLTRIGLCLAALVFVFVFIAIPLRGRTKPRRITDSPFGAYAGYVWPGRVSSVEGSWTVPRIVAPSRFGLATTWIGAQAPGTRGAFIQIGDGELHEYARAHVVENRYWAFWSDTTRNFHPQFLFRVRPGDSLSASLTLAHGRWALAIVDHTSGSDVRFLTSEDTNTSFDEAQWTQEDATTSTGERFPYPSLTGLRFSGLAVNSKPPTYASLYSTWMSVNGISLAPTPLAGDAFALRQATVSPTGEYYLHIGAPRSIALEASGSEFERWTAKTPHTEIASASSSLIAWLRLEIRALASARLPKAVSTLVRLLIGKLNVMIKQARPPAVMSPTSFTIWRSSLIRSSEAAHYVAHLLLRELGLPELP